GRDVRKAERSKRRDLSGVCEPIRSQSPRSTDAAQAAGGMGSKTISREGGQEGGGVKTEEGTESTDSAQAATQGAETRGFAWAEASIWTERMIAALVNGVKGGRWFSLIDKVSAPKTLAVAWAKVRTNGGASGVDGQSIARFESKAEQYLAELAEALRTATYRPQA